MLKKKKKKETVVVLIPKVGRYLSTGSTMINLALSDDPFGGFITGKYYFIVGDSTSGKTFLSMTCFAEATISPDFKDYRLIYDNNEDGMLMNLDRLFNDDVADRVEPPAEAKDGSPVMSDTIESFYFHLDDAIKDGRPFVYVLDSMDGLDTDAANKKFEQHKKAHQKKMKRMEGDGDEEEGDDEKVAGSYGDGKAKKNSEYMRKAMKGLKRTNSILIVLSQTRENPAARYGGKTRAGGKALRFYATAEFWSSVMESIKKKVNNKDRDVGKKIKIQVMKNRITGETPSVNMSIFPSFGIDDIGACVDYLVEEKWWEVTKQTIEATQLGMVGTRDKIIARIEERGREDELREVVGACWASIREASKLRRKNRYNLLRGVA